MENINIQEQILNDYLASDDRRKLYESHPEFDASTLEERLAMVSDADSKNSVLIMLRELVESNLFLYNKFTVTSEAFQSMTIKFYNDIEVDPEIAKKLFLERLESYGKR